MSLRSFRWSPSCECCEGCLIVEDDFNRANNDVVSGWDERSGVWSIASNELHETGNVGALIISNASHLDLSWEISVKTGVAGIIDDAIYSIIANYKDDTHYHKACFQYNYSSETLYIRLYKAGSLLANEAWVVSLEDMQNVVFGLCLQDGYFSGSLSVSGGAVGIWTVEYFTPVLYVDGYKCGLGNFSTVAIDYDDFYATETYITNIECPECRARCCGRCDDWTWDRTNGYWEGDLCFEISSDDCPGVAGTAILYQTTAPPGFLHCVHSEKYWDGVISGGDLDGNHVIVYCGCDDEDFVPGCENYRIELEGAVGALCGVASPIGEPDTCDCDVFELIWLTETYNEETSPEEPCYLWCPKDKVVTLKVSCCPT
jgi:hypothetical protein